jgi:hypothetical protein
MDFDKANAAAVCELSYLVQRVRLVWTRFFPGWRAAGGGKVLIDSCGFPV